MNKEKGVEQMIFELVKMVEKELGTALPGDSAKRLEAALCQQFGGERVYIPKLPKLVSQVKMEALGTGMGSSAVAKELGVTVQWVRKIRISR